jgi:hypothetical protein
LRLTGPRDRVRTFVVFVGLVTEGVVPVRDVISLNTEFSRELSPVVRVVVWDDVNPPRMLVRDWPWLSRLAMLDSRLPRRLPGPDWAVISRQMELVSTWRPSRLRWIGFRCRLRIGVDGSAAFGVAVRSMR